MSKCLKCSAPLGRHDIGVLCSYHEDEAADLRREYREDEARYRAEMEERASEE